MTNINTSISERVRDIFSDCWDLDMGNSERFTAVGSKKYIAPFSKYRGDYFLVEQLGPRIVDPAEVGFPLERGGECSDFTIHQGGLDPQAGIDQIFGFEEIGTLVDGCIVIYYSAPLEFPRPLAGATHSGIFRNGKVLSKWGTNGPIFEHELSAMPYVDKLNVGGREISQYHFVRFKIPKHTHP